MQRNDSRTVELWIRPIRDGFREEHQTLVARLERLVSVDEFDDVVLRTWNHNVAVEADTAPTKRDEFVRERLSAFKQWARNAGVELPSLEEHARVGSGRMGPATDTVVLPQTLLAVFRGDTVEAVYPHVRDGSLTTIGDWLEGVEATGGVHDEPVNV
ncbi:HTH domain-containing protein [Haloferax sp. DFSO52]|uniref:HTH domain-containing protein n=1 Tax=Haloferax sp. DFSO52 TaxID=3388505 RepID=UPI003A84162C